MWSPRLRTAQRECGICAASRRALSPSRGIRAWSTLRRSAPTERMWSRRLETARRGCGICAASGQASSASRGIRIRSSTASFSADGTHVVTASDDKTARVWDLRGERPSFVALEGHQVRFTPRRSAPTGRMWSPLRSDKTARVWDLRGERPSFVALEGHQDAVFLASFSPDGKHVVTASRTARRGCGICAASGRASSPSRGIETRSLRVVQPRRDACAYCVGG